MSEEVIVGDEEIEENVLNLALIAAILTTVLIIMCIFVIFLLLERRSSRGRAENGISELNRLSLQRALSQLSNPLTNQPKQIVVNVSLSSLDPESNSEIVRTPKKRVVNRKNKRKSIFRRVPKSSSPKSKKFKTIERLFWSKTANRKNVFNEIERGDSDKHKTKTEKDNASDDSSASEHSFLKKLEREASQALHGDHETDSEEETINYEDF